MLNKRDIGLYLKLWLLQCLYSHLMKIWILGNLRTLYDQPYGHCNYTHLPIFPPFLPCLVAEALGLFCAPACLAPLIFLKEHLSKRGSSQCFPVEVASCHSWGGCTLEAVAILPISSKGAIFQSTDHRHRRREECINGYIHLFFGDQKVRILYNNKLLKEHPAHKESLLTYKDLIRYTIFFRL